MYNGYVAQYMYVYIYICICIADCLLFLWPGTAREIWQTLHLSSAAFVEEGQPRHWHLGGRTNYMEQQAKLATNTANVYTHCINNDMSLRTVFIFTCLYHIYDISWIRKDFAVPNTIELYDVDMLSTCYFLCENVYLILALACVMEAYGGGPNAYLWPHHVPAATPRTAAPHRIFGRPPPTLRLRLVVQSSR